MSKNTANQLSETRVFKPAKEFSKKARIQNMAQYRALWEESVKRPDKFWAREAADLCWNKKWLKVLDWQEPFAKWFVGGRLNVAENCLDRHLGTARQNKAAIIWEGENGMQRRWSYAEWPTVARSRSSRRMAVTGAGPSCRSRRTWTLR